VHVAPALGELVEVVDHRRDEELLLRGERAVDQRAVDPRRPGDGVDPGVLEPPLVEERAGDPDELALAVPPHPVHHRNNVFHTL
jgi:hypothetical protein